jgi:hypothetical protein
MKVKKTILEKVTPLIKKLEKAGKQFCFYACNKGGADIFLFSNVAEEYSLLAPAAAKTGAARVLTEQKAYLGHDSVLPRGCEEIPSVFGGIVLTESDGEVPRPFAILGFYIVDFSVKEADKLFSTQPISDGGV